MPEIQFRSATAADLAAVAEVFIEARTRCLPFIVWDYSPAVMIEVFGHQMERMKLWVAETGGRIVGFIGFLEDEIEHLYVHPDFHSRGIGFRLLEVALARTGDEVWLWVFQENRAARAFYERRGFLLQYETDGADNMEKTPDARYRWQRLVS